MKQESETGSCIPLFSLNKGDTRVVTTADGLRINCQDSWPAERNVHWLHTEIFGHKVYGDVEKLKEGDVIFDVGANVGLFAVYCATKGPKNMTVHSFEPVPQVAGFCHANMARYCPSDKYKLHQVGLGSVDNQQVEITYFPKCSSGSSIDNVEAKRIPDKKRVATDVFQYIGTIKHPRVRMEYLFLKALPKKIRTWIMMRDHWIITNKATKCQITIRRMSEVIRESGVTKIDFLKVDTEGFDLEVLRGIDDEHWPMIKRVACDLEKDHQVIIDLLHSKGFKTKTEQTIADAFEANVSLEAWREE